MRKTFLLLLLGIGLGAVNPPTTPLVVVQRQPLTQQPHGVSGRLELLLDRRFDATLREELWGAGPWDLLLAEDDPRYRAFERLAPAPAELRLVEASGKVRATRRFDHPLARLETASLTGGPPTFLVTEDYSVGMGSYAGPLTRLLEVRGGRLEWGQAYDAQRRTTRPISLSRTLKYDWRLVPAGAGRHDILQVQCDPFQSRNPDGSEFFIYYRRYHFDGRRWLVSERQRPGMWEADEDFPPAAAFPSAP